MNPSTNKRTRKGYNSIFFKLFAVLLASVVITYLAFGGFYRSFWNANTRMESHKNNIHYSDLLAQEIGSPPDTNLAKNLSRELGQTIGIVGPTLNWHSRNFSPYIWDHFQNVIRDSIETIPGRLVHKDPSGNQSDLPDSINILLHDGRLWTAIDKGDYTYIFGTRRRPFAEGLSRDWILLMTVLSAAWLLAWFVLHRMLNPLKGLEAGVTAVQAGDLDVQLDEHGRDELADLARSFNSMTRSLKERLRARDQLLLDVSHELRSPLTRMRVALEMAPPGPAIESLQEEVEDLGKMVSELLETERLNNPVGQLKWESVDLAAMISQKVAKFGNNAPGILWKNTDPVILKMDEQRMRLVLRNVIDNALKYGKGSSRPVEITLRKEGGYAIVTVQDFGVGIPPDELGLVFEPFYRVDRARSRASGYGLGLSLCRRIVELHGGKIILASRVGEGTRVVIELPLN